MGRLVWGLVPLGFLLGSVPFGLLLARARGIDLTQVGSGNIGASNAARALGRGAGLVVLLLDAGKAWLPTALALRLAAGPEVAAATGFAAFVGHIFSPWLGGKGGKGVACGLGTFLALWPPAALAALLVAALLMALTRIAALGSLCGALALFPVLWWQGAPTAYRLVAALMFLLILFRHRQNLRRLLGGEEHRV